MLNDESERVILTIKNREELVAFRPEGKGLFARLLKKIKRGEPISVSLSKRGIVEKGARQVRISDRAGNFNDRGGH